MLARLPFSSINLLQGFILQGLCPKKLCSKLEASLVCLALPTNAGTEIIRTHRNLFLSSSECKHPVDSEAEAEAEARS